MLRPPLYASGEKRFSINKFQRELPTHHDISIIAMLCHNQNLNLIQAEAPILSTSSPTQPAYLSFRLWHPETNITVRPTPNDFKGEVGLMTMHTNKHTRVNLIMPNS